MPGSQAKKCAYFEESINFFNEYKWVYDFKCTRILSEAIRLTVPPSFQDYFMSLDDTSQKFCDLLFLKEDKDFPPEIHKFIQKCLRLKRFSEELMNGKSSFAVANPTVVDHDGMTLRHKLPKKWNPKKHAEVIHVGSFVGALCKRENCDAVIDIGSGLGYLSGHIASQCEIPVIGIESDPSRVRTATNELAKTPLQSESVLQSFVCLRITENISAEIDPHVEKYKNVGITALHACGDLTPWSLQHFIQTSTCKVVAVVPCCYHKMSLDGKNFPISNNLKEKLSNCGDTSFLVNQWLWRLASQRSGSKFLNDIDRERNNLFYRAIVENVSINENFRLQRRKRNLHCRDYVTFDDYLEKSFGMDGGFDLYREDRKIGGSELTDIIEKMRSQHTELSSWSRVITGILALQGAIQKVAEDLILVDRLTYIEEFDIVKESGLIKVIPEDVSPRGMVLFGIKK